MVPDGWSYQKLGVVAELQRGFDLPSRKRISGNVPIISSGGLSGYHNEAKVKAPGIVTGRYGSIGDVFYIQESFWPLNTSLWVKNFFGNDTKFIYFLLSGFNFKKFSDKTGVPGVNRNDLHAVNVYVPPFSEQQRIAKILTAWDKAITVAEQLITNSQKQKKALMQQLLTGKKRLAGFGGEWREFLLSDLGSTYPGLSGKTKNDFGTGAPFIPYMNIFSNSKINISKLELVTVKPGEKQHRAIYGDVFFTTSSETPEEVGMSSVLLDDIGELYLNSFCFGFRLHNFESILPEFAQYFLRGEDVRRRISVLAQGATRYNLSKIQLMKLKLRLPLTQEQQKIASVLSNADKVINLLKQQLNDLKQEKKALMQQLLTGKRRVKIEKEF